MTAASTADATRPAGVAQPPPRGSRARGVLRLVALAAALVFAAPLVFLLQQAVTFGPPVLDALLDASALGPALRSLLLGTAVAVVTAVIGSGCAWLVTRTDLPLAPAWRLLLALPLVLPSYIGAFTLRAALSPGGLTDVVVGVSLPRVEGFAAALGVLSLLTYPYVYLLVAARLRQLPANLEEQARVLGSTPAAVVRRVVVPQVAPAVLAGALLVFLYVVSDFGAVQLLRYDTLTRAIFANLLDRPASTAYGLQLALLALVVVVGERAAAARVRRLGSGSSPRGTTGLVWSLGRLRTPAVALLGALAVGALLAPLTVLAYWAGRGIVLGEQRASSVLADPAQLLAPLAGSATAGVLAALAATVLVLPVAYLVARHRGRAPAVSNALVVSGFALPGLVIALACAFFALRGPAVAAWLYQSLPLLLLAYVVHFGAQSLRAAQVGIAAVPRSLGDAARTLGAGRLRRFLRVELPLAAPSLLAGAGLVLLSVLKELPATLLLAPPGFRTLATDVWAATEDAFWAEASVLALVLVALSAVLTWLLVLRRADALS